MSSNPSWSQFGVDAMNGGYFVASGNGMLGADVPLFYPSMPPPPLPPPEHGGFGFGFGFGFGDAGATAVAAMDNVVLASLTSQLFGSAPATHGGEYLGARTPPEEEMDSGYEVAGGGYSGAVVTLACAGQSDAMGVWSSSSLSKKPSWNWSNAGDASRTASFHGACHVSAAPEVAGFLYPGHSTATASELSLSLCSKSSSVDSMLHAADQCSSGASRSGVTHRSRAVGQSETMLPLQVYHPQHARSGWPAAAAHFAVVVARSRYAAVAQQVFNDAVGRVLGGGVAEAAGSDSGGSWPSSCSAGAPSSAVSSSNQLMASAGEHPHGGARWGEEAQRLRSELLKLLQMMDEKYNQCLDEIQSTTAEFNSMTPRAQSGGIICAPFARGAVSAMYRGLRRRISGEIMAAGRPCVGESSSSVTAGERGRSWESSFIQKHWAVQQLRRGGVQQQQCWRPQRGLPEKSVAVLKAWMFEHFVRPYPKDSEKDMLAARSGLSRNQVSNWFINARVRIWKPMIEEMCEELSSGSGGGGKGMSMAHRRLSKNGQDVVS